MDCIVIGGGIIGLMTARELMNAGLKVLLVERGEIGQESSWAGGGILLPLHLWRIPVSLLNMVFWSQKYYPKLSEELYSKTGIDPELIQSGMLVLDEKEFGSALEWRKKHDYRMELLSKNETLTLCPILKERLFESALWLRDVFQIRNPRLVKALKKFLGDAGVKIKPYSLVTKINVKHGHVEGIEFNKERVQCRLVVVACGAWSSELMSDLRIRVDIFPIRGQMMLFRGEPGLINSMIIEQGHYIIPRKDGRILVGSTLEDVGFNKDVTQQAFDELKSAAITLVPILESYQIEDHWAGLRPGSKDGIPIISEVPDVKGLFVNAGHFRNGLLLAPASAKLMSDIIQGCASIVDPGPFQLGA